MRGSGLFSPRFRPWSGPARWLPNSSGSQGLTSGVSVFCGVCPWPGMWWACLEGGRSGALCWEQCHSCHRPLRGEAGVHAAGSSEGWTWVLCQQEGMRPGRSALGREIDAPGQTSAVTLGPRHWQLTNLVPAAHLPASPEPRDSVEARRGRGRAQALLQADMG